MAGKRRGRFWFLVVVVEKTNTTTTTKGVIVYMYCIVCTIIHIHLLFLVGSDAAIEVNSYFFSFPFPFVLAKRARRGICGRFRDRLVSVSVSRERVKSVIVRPGEENETRQDRQETQALRGS